MSGTIGGSKLGLDPDYASWLGQRNDPRLLMAQKLMDVSAAPTTNASQSSFWANLLNQGARGALGGYIYNDVQGDRTKEAAAQAAEAEKFRKLIEAGPPSSAGVKDGSGGTGTAPAPPTQGDPGDAGASIQDRLRQRESSGNYGVMNKQRYAGAYQFGSDLLAANGLYQPTEQGEPANTWGGTFSIPGHPNVKTLADFRNTPEAQDTAYRIAMASNDKQLREMGVYEKAAKLGGVTRDGLLAGAWLGGVHGVANWVDSGGQSNPGDANGTRIGDYVRMGSGQGGAAQAGLSPVPTKAAVRAPAMARGGQQADAGPGSNIEALLAGVDAPKPRGLRLAENLVGGIATDAPTPILPAPRVPVVSAALQGTSGPQPPSATVPDAPPALVPGPDQAVVPPPPPATVPGPEPAVVPPPEPAVVPQPEPAVVPANPLGNADPPSLANFNGIPVPPPATVPQPEPAVVPQPEPAVVSPAPLPQEEAPMVAPAGSGETGGQPTVIPPDGGASRPDLPIPVPPIPPRAGPSGPQLAAPLVSGGGGNATEALNTASLAAARRGENFVPGAPGAAPPGPQLAAPLMSWAGNLTAAGAPLLTPAGAAGGPTGPQLAAPLLPPGAPGAGLVTPTGDTTAAGAPGATTDTSAAGGPGKGAAPAAQASPAALADAQAKADWFLTMARQAQGSSNPRIRSQAGMLEAQGLQYQRSVDRQTALNDRLAASREARETAAANRNSETKDVLVGNDVHIFERDRSSGAWKDTGMLSGNQRTQPDRNVQTQNVLDPKDGKVHVYERDPSSGTWKDTGLLHDKQPGEGGGPYAGKGIDAEARNIVDRLHDKIAGGTATEPEKRQYSTAYNGLRDGTAIEVQDPQNPSKRIRVPGKPTDLTGYAPPPYRDTSTMPGSPPTEAERRAAGYARRQDLANAELDKVGPPSLQDVAAGKVPAIGNFLTSDDGQRYRTAALAWVMAKLRPETGAAMTASELDNEFKTYFPQPGEGKGAIELKRRLRELETQNARQAAGNAYTPPSEQAGGGGGPVRITDDAAGKQAMQSLKPGDQFIGPDGKLYTKGR